MVGSCSDRFCPHAEQVPLCLVSMAFFGGQNLICPGFLTQCLLVELFFGAENIKIQFCWVKIQSSCWTHKKSCLKLETPHGFSDESPSEAQAAQALCVECHWRQQLRVMVKSTVGCRSEDQIVHQDSAPLTWRIPGLANIQQAIENGHRNSGFTSKTYSVVISHSYVSLPEGHDNHDDLTAMSLECLQESKMALISDSRRVNHPSFIQMWAGWFWNLTKNI